jgi:hypothetical protein
MHLEYEMPLLLLHNRKIETVFDLLGQKENDMTYALGWALAQSPRFLAQLAEALGLDFSERVKIRLQHSHSSQGYTDVEIDDPGRCHVILEAKRGFTLPSSGQLSKYAARLIDSPDRPKTRLLVVLAESDRQDIWLDQQIPKAIDGITVNSVSWHKFKQLAKRAAQLGTHAEKHLLNQFVQYVTAATTMQNQYSNLVYVVSLSREDFGCGNTTFIDVVEEHHKYFHPVGGTGGGWPAEPPNYLGFRYEGKLSSIHHVETYTVITNFAPHFTDRPTPLDRPHYLYNLGPAIKPGRRMPTNGNGNSIWGSGRRWVFLDLLLTAGSVAEAASLTKLRLAAVDQDMSALERTEGREN